MKRREFITLLGGAAATWPYAARAQQARKLPTVGVLGASTQSNWHDWTAAFVGHLRDLGWVDGQTVAIEYRWAEGHTEQFRKIADEFVQMNVDVIVTVGGAVLATKQATSTIPIVFAIAVDPVGSGLVASLARPGGNVTGLSIQATDLAGKRVEILREIIPNLRRFGIIANVGYNASALEISEAKATARAFGLQAVVLGIRHADDIARVLGTPNGEVQALYVCPDPLVNANHVQINTLALGLRLPTIHPFRDYLGGAGFISYGADNVDLFRRAADYVDKILRGAKPADLPVEQPTKFDLVINIKTAKALGLTIPQTLLATADQIVE